MKSDHHKTYQFFCDGEARCVAAREYADAHAVAVLQGWHATTLSNRPVRGVRGTSTAIHKARTNPSMLGGLSAIVYSRHIWFRP
jgi:hypothetical protein